MTKKYEWFELLSQKGNDEFGEYESDNYKETLVEFKNIEKGYIRGFVVKPKDDDAMDYYSDDNCIIIKTKGW